MKKEDIIQRYMNLKKFKMLLDSNSLYLAKMSIFDDCLEGGLTVNDFLKTSNDSGVIDGALNLSWPVINETSEERKQRLKESNSFKEMLDEKTFSTPFGNYSSNDANELFPKCREWIYVNCWHNSPHECSAMWQLYGQGNDSVCIFTTVDELKKQIEYRDEVDTLTLENVKYFDHTLDDFDSESRLRPFTSKALPFSFEKELRVVGLNSSLDLTELNENKDKGIEIKINSLPQLIHKVVVSPKASSSFFDSIQELCNQYKLDIEVERSSLHEDRKRVENVYIALEHINNA